MLYVIRQDDLKKMLYTNVRLYKTNICKVLVVLGNLQKQVCGAVGSKFAASLEPFAHRWNAASLNLFYTTGVILGEIHLRWLKLPYSHIRLSRYSDRLHFSSAFILKWYKHTNCVNIFFPCTTRIWNSLSTGCDSVALHEQPPDVFYKKGVLKNFSNFSKHLCWSVF